jgi:hypothetical protein
MNMQEIPSLQVPFSKPTHVGYTLGCYRDNGKIYSLPLDAASGVLKNLLEREFVISGESLTKLQFVALFRHVIGAAELCWHDDLEFVVEGANLPLDCD